MSIAQTTLAQWHNRALSEIPAQMDPRTPEVTTVRQFLLSGGKLREVEPRTGIVVTKPVRPSRFWSGVNTLSADAILTSFFALEECWEKARDEDIWNAAASVASGLAGNQSRTLARAVASGLAVRAGLAPPSAREMV